METKKPLLGPCPICNCKTEWCEDNPDNLYLSHLILCKHCGASFDMDYGNKQDVTIEELRQVCAEKFNKRDS